MALARLSVFSVRSAVSSTSTPSSPPSTSPTSPVSTTPSIDSVAQSIPRLDLKVSEPFPGTEWPDDALAAQRRLIAVIDGDPIWVQLLGAPWVVGKARSKNGRVVRLISGEGVRGHDLIRLALQLSNTHITRLTYGVWSAPVAADELIMRTLGRLTSLRTLNIRHMGDLQQQRQQLEPGQQPPPQQQRTAMPVPVLIALLQALPQLEVLTLDCGSEAFRDARFLRALQDRSVRLQRLECGAYHATSAWSISLECEQCWRGAGPKVLDKVKLALDRNRERRRRERRAALRVLVVARVLIHARPEGGFGELETLRERRPRRGSFAPASMRNSVMSTSSPRDSFLFPPSPSPPSSLGVKRSPSSPPVSMSSRKPRRMSLLSLPPIHSPFHDVERSATSVPSSPVRAEGLASSQDLSIDVPQLHRSKSSLSLRVSNAFHKVKVLVTRSAPKEKESKEQSPQPASVPSSRSETPSPPGVSALHRLPVSVRFRIARFTADVTHLNAARLNRLQRYAADRTSLGRIAHAVSSAQEWEVPEAQIRDDWLACGGF
ncbi:uncharacterized protein LOC62_04G005380 [Vanrija pseudolonga]|uniref:Uncharacterized protein n=1 Tax=Vanrija pseudolonga TaxID=143232 RepID=A0AAF0YDL1_9TREE|nr:hypothetical protein LOC62_04G005380 [Vanrija pseudolonga]